MELMNYSEELILQVTELAKIPDYTPGKVARILGIETPIMEDETLRDAFEAGKLIASGELGKKVQQLSNQGSGPAQFLLSKMMKENEVNTIREYYG
jgi:hypothetical protein